MILDAWWELDIARENQTATETELIVQQFRAVFCVFHIGMLNNLLNHLYG
jgi:hypothetical protein